MKAVVYERYGSPDVLRVDYAPRPSPARGQVLVKVAATSVNLSDWEGLVGSPAYARLGGLRKPRRRILGSDLAGRVEAVGDDVAGFQPGDEVYGDNLQLMGGFAEYAVAPETALARKPSQLTFAEASTIPQAGAIALQGTAGVTRGQRVLVNGGGGGSGSFAIQLAKRLGAHVTGVDNGDKLEFWRRSVPMTSSTTAVTTSPAAASRSTGSWTWWLTGRCSPIDERWHPADVTDV